MAETVFIGIGSNQGDRKSHCEEALRRLSCSPDLKVIKTSPFYETEPVTLNREQQEWYLNGAVQIQTELTALSLLSYLKQIEQDMGRTMGEKWSARCIDLDILFYGDQILKSERLTLPHPLVTERRFVLEPLAALAPDWRHPEAGKTIAELLVALRDPHRVRKVP
ncbi:MAG: 2-amino-4-hydroxy-6-hydroxymethyldihydropteridine diphosphokinase [bacterium]|nr:2-amino-4-hydroxy-6-hydroxymethyldihydropteridine diphosphokinase [bacterium]